MTYVCLKNKIKLFISVLSSQNEKMETIPTPMIFEDTGMLLQGLMNSKQFKEKEFSKKKSKTFKKLLNYCLRHSWVQQVKRVAREKTAVVPSQHKPLQAS